MKYYVHAELTVNEDSWVPGYIENVTRLIAEAGGTYLARTDNFEIFEGDRTPPHLCVLIEFPSRDVAQKFYESEAYKPFLDQRKAGGKTELTLIPAEDVANK